MSDLRAKSLNETLRSDTYMYKRLTLIRLAGIVYGILHDNQIILLISYHQEKTF